MIEIHKVSKSFGDQHVLKGVSATFHPGKVNFIIGRSGSGKSVLTKCTVGLLEPDEGHVNYDGRNFTAMDRQKRKAVRQEIGMLFQGSALFDSMTVEENVMFPLRMFSDATEEEMRERAAVCLERVELPSAAGKYPSELSGGMQKRVGIARAIAMNPKYLFCDEPNSGLDPQTAIVIDNLIRRFDPRIQHDHSGRLPRHEQCDGGLRFHPFRAPRPNRVARPHRRPFEHHPRDVERIHVRLENHARIAQESAMTDAQSDALSSHDAEKGFIPYSLPRLTPEEMVAQSRAFYEEMNGRRSACVFERPRPARSCQELHRHRMHSSFRCAQTAVDVLFGDQPLLARRHP